VNPKVKWFYAGLKLVVIFTCLIAISFAKPEHKGLANPAASFIRVATTGTDSSTCGPETNPCRTIQYAINKAGASDYIIAVAEGVYTYNSAADQCSWAITPAVVCIVDKNITILGGIPPRIGPSQTPRSM